ncbi:MAG: type II toxin-antitoxin system Phd/YefM family antitoxin [Nitrospinae bacterium]|nr:type II toxin-antitoxin system Phd/YefM family antitoxin [Nitrospinota bacterium]
MIIIDATAFQRNGGLYFQKAAAEPVTITKHGRPAVTLISHDEYERLKAMEDAYWAIRAKAAESSGALGHKKALRLIEEAARG